MADGQSSRRAAPADRRLPLVTRRARSRQEARLRVARATRRGLSEAQRLHDPLEHGERGRARRALIATGAVLASAVLHFAIVQTGKLDLGRGETRQEVAIEVRERLPPPPPPPPPEPEPEPEPAPRVERPAAPPPKAEPPPPAPKAPPPRVVGLSLDSTSAVGGEGPSFAVGNTRSGRTAEQAVDPQAVPSEAPPPEAAVSNQAASRIPTAGVRYTQPKRRRPTEPPYPDMLKTQGVEANVVVMVTLDSTGKVTKVKILKEAPFPEFNEAARRHALSEEYEPALRDGVPIPYSLTFMYRFRLEDAQ